MIKNVYSIALNFYSAVIWVPLQDFWPIRILNETTLSSLPLIINRHNNSSSTSKDNLLVKKFWTLSVYRNPKQYYIKKNHKAKTSLGQAYINCTTIWSHARNYMCILNSHKHLQLNEIIKRLHRLGNQIGLYLKKNWEEHNC